MNTIKSTQILLPNVKSLEKWSVVSCDQFTSQPEYWNELSNFVGDSESALKLILPEVYLEKEDCKKRIETIKNTMKDYLKNDKFIEIENSFILVKRDTGFGFSRLGLVVAVDLEDYSFNHPSNAPIRSTEGVVYDRIPPRLKVRNGADIELPHIMLLIDDRNKTIIEKLYENIDSFEIVYDFDLNMNGGHLTGYKINSDIVLDMFDDYEKRIAGIYGMDTNFIFAVGDGNHSLATAQAHWNNVKEELNINERENHPARFALCEIENLHSDGITFEPIHRFLFNVCESNLISYFMRNMSGKGEFKIFSKNKEYTLNVNENSTEAIVEIQNAIDEFIAKNGGEVDYIHGMKHLQDISSKHQGIAICMPTIEKQELFEFVLKHGNLCRKAFSMGEAEEKRYYLEAKKIR